MTEQKFRQSEKVVATQQVGGRQNEDQYVLVPRSQLRTESKEELKRATTVTMRNGKSSKAHGDLPLPLQITPKLSMTYRYRATSALTADSITVEDILGSLGGICTVANTSLKPWTGSFRIVSVTIWPAAGSALTLSSVQWGAGEVDQVPDTELDETIPAGMAVTKSLTFAPPKNSLASMWITAADPAVAVMVLRMPSGSVCDLRVESTLSNNVSASVITIAAGTLSSVYYLALNGAGTNTLVPSQLPSTA